jgi:hypothetical protein
VLAEGNVLEQGSPAALLEKDGWFSRFALAAEQGQQAAGQEDAADTEEEDEEGDQEAEHDDEDTPNDPAEDSSEEE